jgi:D-ornithine 4,5-aminomutase subunit beta
MPELMVQHAINALFSAKVGMNKKNICLSTVPPTATPAPCVYFDLPYAVALRELFHEYRMRAQMNTKYIEASAREATVTHVLNMFISKLTSADIQSTITPDEGRNVPWHIYNVEACDTAKQTLVGLDGLMEMVELKDSGYLRDKARELKERAVLFMEEMLEMGGYFKAVEAGYFVDSGMFPERNGDGIVRKIDGGIGAGMIYKREKDYFAPVTAHYGYNNVAQYDESAISDPARLIGGCTLEAPEKIQYIDELDDTDNVNARMESVSDYKNPGAKQLKPEMEWLADGTVMLTMFFPTEKKVASAAALEFARRMNLVDPEVINCEVMHGAEGTRIEVKGKVGFSVNVDDLVIPKDPEVLSDNELRAAIEKKPMRVVCGTVGEDEHSVGLREIIDIKHGGIEKYGIEVFYLGTSVPPEKLVNAAIELNADAMLASTVISHDDIHYKNIAKIDRIATEMGVRDKLMFLAGGTQVDPATARKVGADEGFSRGTKGCHVATFLVKRRMELQGE